MDDLAENSREGPYSPAYRWQIEELREAREHALRMEETVKKHFYPRRSRTSTTIREKMIEAQRESLRNRLQRYPLESTLDEAWGIADDLLLPLLSDIIGPVVARDFLQEISFFRPPPRSPLATSTQSPDLEGEPTSFRLPVLLITHQHPNLDLDPVTRNVQRLCCVSAARFLAVLGIVDFPVYGLVMAGSCAYPCVAWYSADNKVGLDLSMLRPRCLFGS